LHVEEFSKRVIKYHNKYNNEDSILFIKSALGVVDECVSENNHITSQINKWRLKAMKDNLNKCLENSN